MRKVLFISATLLCLAACNRDAAPAAASADVAAPETMRTAPAVVASAPVTSKRPVPAPTEANLAMQRAAQSRVVLRPCSTLSGDAYAQCKAENAAAIARSQGTQPKEQ